MRVILSAGKNLLDEIMFNESGSLEKLSEDRARELSANGFVSTVGLPQTKRLFGQRLGMNIELGTAPVTIQPVEDLVIVGEYDRTVCFEDRESFPSNAKIDWYLVRTSVPITWQPPG
jgi:hypothetical protein